MRAGVAMLALMVAFGAGGCDLGNDSNSGPTTRVVLEVVPAPGRDVSQQDLEEAAEIMSDRIDKLGVDATIASEGNQIAIDVPQNVVDRFVRVVPRTARLEFFDLQGDLVQGVSLDAQGFPVALNKKPKARPKTVIVTCGPPTPYCPGLNEQPTARSYYLFQDEPDLTGADLELKGTRQDFDQGGPVVLIQFTDEGAKKFQAITRTLAERGRMVANQNGWSGAENDVANQQFAIVLDGEMRSAPSVDFDDNPGGIPGDNGAQITGLGSLQEAKDLALVLETGALPIDFRVVSKEEVPK